jgi:hypothetical protein
MELGDQLLVMLLDVVADALLGLGESLDGIFYLLRAKPEDLFGLQVNQNDTVDLGRIRNETVALCVV